MRAQNTDVSGMDNVLYIEPFTVEPGTTEVTLEFKMKNVDEVHGTQFDLYLPEGVTVKKSSKGKIVGNAFNEDRLPEESGHTIQANEKPEGFVTYLISSFDPENFEGNEGVLFTQVIILPADMAEGDYEITMKEMTLSNIEGGSVAEFSEVKTTMTIAASATVDPNFPTKGTNPTGYLYNTKDKLFLYGADDTSITGDVTGANLYLVIEDDATDAIKGNSTILDDTKAQGLTETPQGHTYRYMRFYTNAEGNYRMKFGDDGPGFPNKNMGYSKWAVENAVGGWLIRLLYATGDGYSGDDKQGFFFTPDGYGKVISVLSEHTASSYWTFITDEETYNAKVEEAIAAHVDDIVAAAPTGTMTTPSQTALETAINTFKAEPTLANYTALKEAYETAEAAIKLVADFATALAAAQATAATTEKINATELAALQTAIETNETPEDTDEAYEAAITALKDADAKAKTNIQAYKDIKKALEDADAAAAEFSEISKAYYDNNIATYTAIYEGATVEGDGAETVAAINNLLVTALAKDLKPGDDATAAIANPQFNEASGGIPTGWSGDFGKGQRKGDASNYVVTNYGKASDVYQELEGMKKGFYKLEVQAYTRLQTSDAAEWDWQYILNGQELDNFASIYANGVEKKVHNITDKVYAAKGTLGTWAEVDGVFMPYNAASCSEVFTAGDYDNFLYCEVGDDGKLKLGVKNEDTSDHGYIAFDNFRLTYVGETMQESENIKQQTANMKIDADGYSTFVAPFDVTIPEGVKVYTVDAINDAGTEVVMTEVKTTISANTPVVVTSEAAVNETFSGWDLSTDLVAKAGLLTGVYTEKRIPATKGFVIAEDKFSAVAGAQTIQANRAYLYVADTEAESYDFDSTATAIKSVFEKVAQKAVFNLSGQQINSLQKGINIVDGKKVMVK